jgi:hypothetical protein
LRKILTSLATLGIAVSLPIVLASPAIAADGIRVCNTGPQRSCGDFEDDGDKIYVDDTYADGHAAVVRVQIPGAGVYENLWNTDGNGTTRTRSYGTSVAEGLAVYYQACSGVTSTGQIYDCSGWNSGRT